MKTAWTCSVIAKTTSFPLLLLHLVQNQDADADDGVRRYVATSLVDMDDDALQAVDPYSDVAFKVKHYFARELELLLLRECTDDILEMLFHLLDLNSIEQGTGNR